MLFLRSWLEDYIDLSKLTNEELVELITKRSSEVEEAQVVDDYFEGKVLIGRIENTRGHPQADRLKIFEVNLGSNNKIQIVSAAPNVRDGLIVPVAVEGCRLPFLTIASKKMRGEVSEGMCLGKSELMLETEFSSGLWELNKLLDSRDYFEKEGSDHRGVEVFLGKSICAVLPEYFPAETIVDIKVLPDKIGTIGNHLGISIELATCLGNFDLLKPAAARFLQREFDALAELQKFVFEKSEIKIDFEDPTGYTKDFWLFDLKLQKANDDPNYYLPHELVKRMFLTERHVIGGLADLSNYVLADLGQPTHFFSQEKTLTSGQESWKILQLKDPLKFNGLGQLKQAEIPRGVQIIEDTDGRAIAIPAISGSEATKTDFHEKEIILEVANFDADEVARNSFLLKYRSEGAKIWAGKVRQTQILAALLKFIEILHDQDKVAFQLKSILHWSKDGSIELKAAGDRILSQAKSRQIQVDLEFIASRLDNRGYYFWEEEIVSKLKLLGDYDAKSRVLRPHLYFTELSNNYDLLLEVSRLIGFDSYREHSVHTKIDGDRDPQLLAFNKIRIIARQYGFDEVITRPFVSPNMVFDQAKSLEVVKSYRSQEPYLRDRLVFSLATCLSDNLKRGEKKPKIFELNRVYQYGDWLNEKIYLAGILVSNDPYLLTTLGIEVLTQANLEGWQIEDLDQPLNQIGQGYFYNSGTLDFRIVQLNNSFKKSLELPISKTVWYFEFDLTEWDYNMRDYPEYCDESQYPVVFRSYSFLISKDWQWQKILNLAISQDSGVFQIDLKPTERLSYSQDQDILNFHVKFVSHERTLTSEEIDNWSLQFIAKLQEIGPVTVR